MVPRPQSTMWPDSLQHLLELQRKEGEAEQRARERARRASSPPLIDDHDQQAQPKEKDLG
jgi:hypothetical protein